jgi:hypothetical protein
VTFCWCAGASASWPREDGYSLHAARAIEPADRQGLLAPCRYGLRPAVSAERLDWAEDGTGRVRYRMKRRFSNGTSEVCLAPTQLLRRLAALVPPPRVHLVRDHGAFAPRAHGRAALTGQGRRGGRGCAGAAETTSTTPADRRASTAAPPWLGSEEGASPSAPPWSTPPEHDEGTPPWPEDPTRPRRIPWADLLRRVYRNEVMVCDWCGGKREVLAYVSEEAVTQRILRHLGLPDAPVVPAPARGPPENDLWDWDGERGDVDVIDVIDGARPPSPDDT